MTEVLEKVYKKNKDIDLSRLAKRESEVVDPDIMTNTLPKIITVYWDYVVVNKTNYTIVCGS